MSENKNEKKISTKRLVLLGVLAALVAAGSAIRITMPISIAGTTSFHLGNILCALSGILLGPWGGALAAGMGSAIYDMFNPLYISEAWITFLLKGALGLAAGLIAWTGNKRGTDFKRNILSAAGGALTYAALYLGKSYFYNARLVQGLEVEAALATIVAKLPATGFNAAVSIIFAPILASAIQKALARSHQTLE